MEPTRKGVDLPVQRLTVLSDFRQDGRASMGHFRRMIAMAQSRPRQQRPARGERKELVSKVLRLGLQLTVLFPAEMGSLKTFIKETTLEQVAADPCGTRIFM